jgi:Glycosyl transferase family 2
VSVPISVVVPTSQPWPEVQSCFEALHTQARELGAELIVLDPHGRGLPDDAESRYPGVVHTSEPGASILRMRQIGLAAARGDVVAITEDHCLPPPGWLKRHLAAHEAHPEFAIIAGPVTNGATARFIDWAIFIQNHARWYPPLPSGERQDVDRSNVSYKRRVLPNEPSPGGWNDARFDDELFERGERCWLDADNPIPHIQSLGLWGTLVIEFSVGRSVAGLQSRHGLTRGQRLKRLATSPLIAAVNLRAVLRVMLERRRVYPRRALASLPLIAVISVVLAAGFLAGYAAGPGDSTRNLR